ncbi:uncharacterized protein LOC135697363, partial [Ochlerotatus camptorhynchus]|uniref:uncharacterized protein LOC135697363 n=1 Tax=Ochlerotatus camptorhynchus TaxID=644619 RepID=UPI0031E247EA
IIVASTSQDNETLPLLEPGHHLRLSDSAQRLPFTNLSTEVACCSNSHTLQAGNHNVRNSNDNLSDENGLASAPKSSSANVFTPRILLQLLQNTEEGKDIIKYANISELSEAKQLELAGIIAKYHLNTKSKLHTEDLEIYALAVTSLFKHEQKENYFIQRSGDRKNHGGKITNKIGNLKQRKRKRETKENEYQTNKQKIVDTETAINAEAEGAAEWLMLNGDPWAVVLEQWKRSHDVRKPDLLSAKSIRVLTTYQHYKSQHGYQLIDIDFQKLFPNAVNGWKKLENLIPEITQFISKKAMDPSAASLLEQLSVEGASTDTKLCALLQALNTVLPPISAASRFKPTILAGHEDVLLFAVSRDQAHSKIQAVYRSYAERNLPTVPKLVAVGESLEHLQGRFFVIYNDVCYELASASRAVDVIIKLTAVFGLPYSKITKLVWHFISGYVYGIKQRESYACINKLQNYLDMKNTQQTQ